MITALIVLGLIAIFGVGLLAQLYWLAKIAAVVVVGVLLFKWARRKLKEPAETK